MDLSKLGYSENWIKFNFINEGKFEKQLSALEAGDEPAEFYRYNTFISWLNDKSVLTDNQIDQFLELAREDKDKIMAGKAVSELFTSSIITSSQFEILKAILPSFGDWTKKLITRETLTKKLASNELDMSTYQECLKYKKEFNDNRLLLLVINQSNSIAILSDFENNGCGKRIKTLANKKLSKLKREKDLID